MEYASVNAAVLPSVKRENLSFTIERLAIAADRSRALTAAMTALSHED